MTRENVEVAWSAFPQRSYDVANEETRRMVVARLSADVVWEEDPRFPEAGTYRGREEILGYLTQFTAPFDEFIIAVEDVLDTAGDEAVVLLHIQGRGRDSSATFDFHPAWVYTVRGGEIVHIRGYFERREALEAVGLAD